MNLIDFHVTEIISEERDKVWKLYGMSESELEKEKNDVDDQSLVKDGLTTYYQMVSNRSISIGMTVVNLLEKAYLT